LSGDAPPQDPRARSQSTRSDFWRHPRAGRARFRRAGHQSGQGLIEYGLILVLMAVVCTVSLLFFGDQLSYLLSLIGSAV
jgi:Flp pilus assembly pilin Flp